MYPIFKHFRSVLLFLLLLSPILAEAQDEIGCSALEDYFKRACLAARQGYEKGDQYDLTDALVYLSRLTIANDSLVRPHTPGVEKVFGVEGISRYFDEEKDIISLAQDAEMARGDADMTISLTHDTVPSHGSVTYEGVSCDGDMMYLMVVAATQTPLKVSVKGSDKKKKEVIYEDKKSIAKGEFPCEGLSFTITIENASDQDVTIAIAVQ